MYEASSGITTTYAYDYESRISSISKSGMTTNTFAYNGLDTRVSKVDSGGTKTYKRAGAYVTAPVLSDGSAEYTPGVSERRSGSTSYFMTERLGTRKGQTSSSAAVTATRTFDAFGMLVSSTGSSSSPFGFAGDWGYQEDPDTGVKLLGHRYYDASTGRFLTRDPIKDGRNWYGYCDNNPLKFVDPAGLDKAWYDWIYKNKGKKWADKYKNDKDFRDRIHREGGKLKDKRGEGKGGKRNEDLSDEEKDEVFDNARNFIGPPKPVPAPAPKPRIIPRPNPRPTPGWQPDWDAIGKGAIVIGGAIVVGGIIIVSGGTLAPAAAAVGGVIVVGAGLGGGNPKGGG